MTVTMPTIMAAKSKATSGFGERLIALRKERGLTQVQLAEAINSTQRAISYYENHATYPPATVLADLAQALGVTTDELLGVQRARRAAMTKDDPEARRVWKKFQQLLTLPEKDQRAVIRLVNSLVAARSNGH
jgi:transcriptional regulator with XRE-family HTH domain